MVCITRKRRRETLRDAALMPLAGECCSTPTRVKLFQMYKVLQRLPASQPASQTQQASSNNASETAAMLALKQLQRGQQCSHRPEYQDKLSVNRNFCKVYICWMCTCLVGCVRSSVRVRESTRENRNMRYGGWLVHVCRVDKTKSGADFADSC